MINGSAAGHTFKDGLCICGRRLVDIQYVTRENDVGKPNIAHAGLSTIYEIDQIRELVAKARNQVNNSFGWRD